MTMRTADALAIAALAISPLLAHSESIDPAVDDLLAHSKFCSATAEAELRACRNQTLDDYWIGVGICINESDARDRAECVAEAKAARDQAKALCGDQHDARIELCGSLGERRYDPEFEPGSFERDYANLRTTNPFFPLAIGSQWEFRSESQTTKVRVLNATKLIDEVRCVVVRDEVSEDGVVIEGTNDWFAQARDGAVWYCGEETATFETFAGDRPRKPELVSIDGSFKAGRDGDKPGIIFLAKPRPGQTYVEESSLANAEDATEVLSVKYAYGKDPTLDQLVPKKLAQLLCAAGDCVVTKNSSPLDPGTFERKYYARGIGVFLEVEPESGEVVQLVKCNVDPRCASLPH
jgi:hypothetical protein